MSKGYQWKSTPTKTTQEWCERCAENMSVNLPSLADNYNGKQHESFTSLDNTLYRDANCVLCTDTPVSYDAICHIVNATFDDVLATAGPAPGEEPETVEVKKGVTISTMQNTKQTVYVDVWDQDAGSKTAAKNLAHEIHDFITELFPVDTTVARYEDKYTILCV